MIQTKLTHLIISIKKKNSSVEHCLSIAFVVQTNKPFSVYFYSGYSKTSAAMHCMKLKNLINFRAKYTELVNIQTHENLMAKVV